MNRALDRFEARREGYAARMQGKQRNSNPYFTEELKEAWFTGYDEASKNWKIG